MTPDLMHDDMIQISSKRKISRLVAVGSKENWLGATVLKVYQALILSLIGKVIEISRLKAKHQ